MARMAIIKDGTVLNVIALEPGADWKVPDGCTLEPATERAEPGCKFAGGKFIDKPQKVRIKPELKTLIEAEADMTAIKNASPSRNS